MYYSQFDESSLEESVVLYKELLNMADCSLNLRLCADAIYAKFFDALDRMIHEKYRHIFLRMGFDTYWRYDFDQELTSRRTSFSIIYDMDEESGKSDYEPLVEFVIHLNEGKLNNEYLTTVFEAMSEKLSECFEKTFVKWSATMAEYYRCIQDHYLECVKGEYRDAPTDDPERYFLTHKIIMLR